MKPPHDRSPSDVGVAPPDSRLPAATHLGRVRLQVTDLDRSLAWYEGVLGLDVRDRRDGEATLTASGADDPLVELHELPGATPVPRGGRLGLYHYALLLPDRPSLGAFLRHLAERNEHVGAADHLVSEALYLNDPDGLGIEVYADRPRSAWQADGRELRMDTVALNAEDLVRSAGDARWSGMPAGTTMGHVHLHVGDLDEADAFYHRILGFDRIVWSYPGALFLSAGGYHHHLGLNTWSQGRRPGEDDARLLDWEIRLPDSADVEAVASSVEANGRSYRRTEDGIRLEDPWGTAIRIVHSAGRNALGSEPNPR